MAENKRYYWLKLKEDFFEDDTIQWIEEQENGKEYSLFYLKLCLKSLSMDGKVARIVGNNLMPYDKRALSKATNTDVDTVVIALELFKAIGLVEILDSGEIFMTQINELVGSETDEARKKRRQRANIANNQKLLGESGGGQQGDNVPDNVPELSDESPPEYREESKEISTTTTNIFEYFESNMMIRLSPINMQEMYEYIDDFKGCQEILELAVQIAVDRNKRSFGFFKTLLNEWAQNSLTSAAAVKLYEADKYASKNRKPPTPPNKPGGNRYKKHV